MPAWSRQPEQVPPVSPVSAGKNRLRIVAFVLLISVLGCSYLWYSLHRYQRIAAAEVTMLAESLEAVMHPEHIANLTGTPDDLNHPDYIINKASLIRISQTTNPIHFAYLLVERGGSLLILMDSEPLESSDYSPPGQIYEEATDIYRQPFRTGETTLTPPTRDRWGEWISALVPVRDPVDGRIVAVFGIDYDAAEWNARIRIRMIPDLVITGCVVLLLLAALRTWAQHDALKRLSRKLAHDEALYRNVFTQAPIGIAIVNDKNFVIQSDSPSMSMNPMFEQILGRKADELVSIPWPAISHPDDLPGDLALFKQFRKGVIDGYSLEKRFYKADGSPVWTHMKISPLEGISQERDMHLCLLEDISSRKEMEESLRESERSKTVLLSHLPGMAYRCQYDPDWTMEYVSDGCYALCGYLPENLLYNRDLSFNELIAPEYRAFLWEEWKRTLADRRQLRQEYEITTATGERKWVLEIGEGIFGESGEVEALEGIIIDISDRKVLETALQYTSDHERWTGLYNRRYLETLLHKEAGKHPGVKRALVGINLGTTHIATTTFGFHYTQDLIKRIADALQHFCDEDHALFNTFFDRFAIYVRRYDTREELLELCESIASVLEIQLRTERIGGGIGLIEITPENEFGIDLLLRNVLIATERAIGENKEKISTCVCDAAMEAQIGREEEIQRELARIIDGTASDLLYLHFQPILDLQTSRVVGFEALARMKTEQLGFVSPIEFIPVAEKTKRIIPLGYKIFEDAFRFQRKLAEAGYADVSVSVNVSAIQLLSEGFADRLLSLLAEWQIDPQRICVELTESVFASNLDEINTVNAKLRSHGICIAIDDFGTGYSSLAREHELQVDSLKIDKSFIDRLLDRDPNRTITGDIVSMAHKMGHNTVAEGVELEEQRLYLIEHGCDLAQGYLFSRPLDETAALAYLAGKGPA